LVGKKLIRMIACPGCGRHSDPASGPCSKCGTRVCSGCQLILFADERICPRCGQHASTITATDSRSAESN
jgi:RNA polymerase subunit RPABC4/transcription elongation factor Spt4